MDWTRLLEIIASLFSEAQHRLASALVDETARAELTDDEVGEAEGVWLDLFRRVRAGEVDDVETDDVELLAQIGEAAGYARTEAQTRFDDAAREAEAQAEREAEAARLEAEVFGDDGDPEDPEGDPAPAGDPAAPAPEDAPDPADPPAPAAPEGEPAPVTAAGLPTRAAIQARTPASAQPRVPVITGGEPRIMRLGDREYVSLDEFAETLAERWEDILDAPEGVTEKLRLGRLRVEYPGDRAFSSGEAQESIDGKLGRVLDNAPDAQLWSPALTASGGFCAPVDVDYGLAQISGAQRPVWDYLPKFGADRGGIRYMKPTSLADIKTSNAQTAGSAVSIWTEAVDLAPGSKPFQTISCGTETVVKTRAIVERVRWGNFGARAFPEWVRKWMADIASAFSRVFETSLLDDIDASCTGVTTTQVIGATRDLLANMAQAAARYRSFHRMAPNARLRVMVPAWVPEMVAADLIRQQPGDGLETLAVAYEAFRTWCAVRNLNVTFYEDTATGAGQVFGAQGPTDLRNWPSTVRWYLFHEGAFLGLDGGTLDLGLVRDSTLNNTNDFEMFMEQWAAVAYRGVEALKVTSTVCPDGKTSLPVSISSLCAAS